MTYGELQEAMLAEDVVVYDDMMYLYISAIIFRKNKKKKGEVSITAELMDKNGRSVSIVDASKIERKEFKT